MGRAVDVVGGAGRVCIPMGRARAWSRAVTIAVTCTWAVPMSGLQDIDGG